MDRIERLKDFLDNHEAILIFSDINIRYLTSLQLNDSALLITKEMNYIFVDGRYYEATLREKNEALEVVLVKNIYSSIEDIIKKALVTSVYIEYDRITLKTFSNLKKIENVRFNASALLSEKIAKLRMIKTEDEIEKIKTAQKITDKAFNEVLNYVKEGVSERELALQTEYLLKSYGAENVSFNLITITGKNTSLPHGIPTDTLVKNGDFITFDIGCIYDGYCSDMTRTIALKNVSDRQKQIYNYVLGAHIYASNLIKPGANVKDIDQGVRNYFSKFYVEEYFTHSTGHGVGLEIHEGPTVSYKADCVLKSNMVITNEPGLYLPDEFGVRIEDMYLLTETSCESLASVEKDLIIV